MRRTAVTIALVLATTSPAIAQGQASISGVVKDASGAVMPGVSVEASSPALIEKVRSVVTDNAGAFAIVDLRPGTYTVTFTLPGFTTVRREGIELSGAFNAEVNADLRVGGLEESITVSGASPVVDVKSTLSQSVLTKEQIETLPGGRTLKGRAALIPGVIVPNANTGVVSHGSDSNDSNYMTDGYKSGMHLVGRGTGGLGVGHGTQTQEAAIEELVYDTGGQGAEFASSGVRMNMIPKEGGNRFVAEGIAYASNRHFESSNITPELAAQGLRYAYQLFAYDFNPTVGGPIRKNKLWYFASFSANENDGEVLDIYFKPNEPSTPAECRDRPVTDPSQWCPATTGAYFNTSETVRITHQLTPKHKLRYSFDNTRYVSLRGNFTTGGTKVSPEASWYLPLYPTYLAQAKYTAPLTNRLLIEAGVSYERGDFVVDFQPANPATNIAKWDRGTSWVYENQYLSYTYEQRLVSTKASVSYVTGSHSVKAGYENRTGNAIQTNPFHGDMSIRYVINDVPSSVVVVNGLAKNTQEIRFDGGTYLQDQWKINRLTINAGGRWDHFNAGIPANSAPASSWTPAVSVGEISNVPNWNDFNLRLGGAYDLFGNGRTAVKASMGRYVGNHALDMTGPANPLYSKSDERSWTDVNGDGTVINADGTPQYNEVGPSRTIGFGTLAGTTTEEPGLRRDKNMSYEVSVQHTLVPRVSVSASYYHRRYYDLIWTDNLATAANTGLQPSSDYIPVTFKGPSDARFPGGGGENLTIYTLNPALLGQVNNQFKNSDTNYRKYDYMEFAINAPLPHQGFVMTSWSPGKVHQNTCQVDNPNSLRFCEVDLPFRSLYKVAGGVPLPWGFSSSAVFQIYDTPGSGLSLVPPYISANYAVTSAIAGYPLTGGGSINVNLVKPGDLFNDYYKILDARVLKSFSTGRLKTTVMGEFYNILNMTNVVSVSEAYSTANPAAWARPNALQRGRQIRGGVQMRF
ncbi:MAG TPA: carboxypeptidase regulatory-like domain-containing protein [Vicinamibacterales bacterium]|jgi:hypothetical protein